MSTAAAAAITVSAHAQATVGSCAAMTFLYVALLYSPTVILCLPPPNSFESFLIRRFACTAISFVVSAVTYALLLGIKGLSDLPARPWYGMMRGIGNGGYKNGDGYLGEGCGATASRLKRQISFSSRQNSATSGLISQILEMESEGMSPEHEESSQCYGPGGFLTGSWDDSVLSDSYFGLKRSIDGKLVNGINQSEAQNGGLGSSDMATIEKLLQFQDSVPCKIRAKRECATHPRSIAERVRRTWISERMRKLQELVPNMDKQTNTADMLDLVVEYIKDLQGQVKFRALSDQFYRTPEHHKFVREQVVNQLKAFPEIYEGYVPMDYEEYIRNMSKCEEWGDHVTLQAATDLVRSTWLGGGGQVASALPNSGTGGISIGADMSASGASRSIDI